MHVSRRARLAPLGCLFAAGLVLAACGGSSSNSASPNTAATTTTTPGGRGGFSLTAFRTCMTSHGVTIATRGRNGTPGSTTGGTRPSGASGGGGGGFGFGGGGNLANRFSTPPKGVDPTKYAAALAACKSTLPTGGGVPNNSAFQAYRSCLSDHGVTLPATGGTGSINRNDPKVQAATKTCRALLPAGGFGRSTTTTVAHA